MSGRPAVLLDRDGTILVEKEYLSDPDQAELIEGAGAALRKLRDAGYAVVVVTNQSGIARGLYGESDFLAVEQRMRKLLRAEGADVDRTYHCPHHPDYTGPCDCRKPGTRLFHDAIAELGLDGARSFLVGDRLRDIAPARLFGATPILVRTGYGREEEAHAPDGLEVVDDLAAAADRILQATAP